MRLQFTILVCVLVAACSGSRSSPQQLDAAVPDSTISFDAPDAAPPVPDPSQSSIVTDRDTAVAGVDVVLVTVTIRDASAHPIEGLQVALTATGTGNQISTPAPTDANGVTTATWSSTQAASEDLQLSVGGVVVATHTVTFTPGPITQLAFVTQPSPITIAGAPIGAPLEVAVEDSNGNVVPGATGYIQLSLATNPENATVKGQMFAPVTNGVASFGAAHVDVAGTGYTLDAAFTGIPGATSSAFDVILGSPDQAHSHIDALPASLDADGVSTTTLTVHVANPYGIALPSIGVSFAVSGSNNTLAPGLGMTASDGTAAASLSSTTAEIKTVTATVASTFDVSVQVHFHTISCKPQLPTGPWSLLDHPAQHMIAADVDGDGHVDAVIAEPGYQVAIYRGRGDGTFYPPTSLAMSAQVHAIVAGDLNGDGLLDLVFAVQGASSLEVALGTGGGNFAAPTTISLPAEAYAVAIGDFDSNGKLDLAISLPSSDEVLIEMGAGNGTFTAGATIGNVSPTYVAVVDVNNDGKLDVLISGSAIYAALGNGTGGFSARISSSSEGSGKLFVGDFNHDAKPDVLVSGDSEVFPMLGNGDGTFTTAGNAIETADYPTDGGEVFAVDGGAIADLDADGKPDAIIESGSMLSILKGNGDGTFTVNSAYAGAGGMAYADTNGDGMGDVIAMTSHAFGVLPGALGGQLVAPGVHVVPGTLLFATADLDGNGQLDLVRDRPLYGFVPELSHPDGSITDAQTVPESLQPYGVAFADVTGDGLADLVALKAAVNGVTLETAAGNGDGTFQSLISQAITTPYVTGLIPANLNGDSRTDLVFASNGVPSGVWFALAQTDGTFGPLQATSASAQWFYVDDVTGDGISDLLSRAGNGDLVVFPGTGSGGFGVATTYPASGLLEYAVLADVDGDGVLDVVSLHQDAVSHVYLMAVMRGLGSGAFGSPIVTPSLALPADLSVVDLHLIDVTGDGNLDVVAATTYGAMVLAGYGDGYFRQHAFFYPFVVGQAFVISDHNNDARPDIAFGPAMGIAIAFDTGCTP